MKATIITDKEDFINFIDQSETPLRIVKRKVYAGANLIAVLVL